MAHRLYGGFVIHERWRANVVSDPWFDLDGELGVFDSVDQPPRLEQKARGLLEGVDVHSRPE